MNKYQEALSEIADCLYRLEVMESCGDIYCFDDENIETLKELVEKATPKKVLSISVTHEGRVGNCPNCKKFVAENSDKPNICACGQKLNWGNNNGKQRYNFKN